MMNFIVSPDLTWADQADHDVSTGISSDRRPAVEMITAGDGFEVKAAQCDRHVRSFTGIDCGMRFFAGGRGRRRFAETSVPVTHNGLKNR